MRTFFFGLAAMSTALPASAKVKLEDVTYRHGDAVLEGVFVYDDAFAASVRSSLWRTNGWARVRTRGGVPSSSPPLWICRRIGAS